MSRSTLWPCAGRVRGAWQQEVSLAAEGDAAGTVAAMPHPASLRVRPVLATWNMGSSTASHPIRPRRGRIDDVYRGLSMQADAC